MQGLDTNLEIIDNPYLILSENGVTDSLGNSVSSYKGVPLQIGIHLNPPEVIKTTTNIIPPITQAQAKLSIINAFNMSKKLISQYGKHNIIPFALCINHVKIKTASNRAENVLTPTKIKPIEKDKISKYDGYDKFVWVNIFGEIDGNETETGWAFWKDLVISDLAAKKLVSNVSLGLFCFWEKIAELFQANLK